MTEERLETVAAYSYLHDAVFAKSCLESEGIPAVIENENLIRLDWLFMNALGGLRIQVLDEDAARAREILARPEPSADEPSGDALAAEHCKRCGSQATEAIETRRKVGHMLWLLTGFPFVRPGDQRRCASCGLVLPRW